MATEKAAATPIIWWPAPEAGDIVWCRFPGSMPSANAEPPKPRPGLVLEVYDDQAPHFEIKVVHATKQRVNELYSGEFSILLMRDPAAYKQAGLSYDSKFCMKDATILPFNSEWFYTPPGAPHGPTPKLGTLHPSMVYAAGAAYNAVFSKS